MRNSVVGLVLAVAASTAPAQQWTVTILHFSGAEESAVDGAAAGQQVGFARLGPTLEHRRASLWRNSSASWVNLHPAAAISSQCHAARGGRQVGQVLIGNARHASMWIGTAATWVDLHPPGASSSVAYGIGSEIQVGYADIQGPHACLWLGSAATFADLNPGANYTSMAFATEGSYQVGYVEGPEGIHAALWGGGWTDLHPPGNIASWAYGVYGVQPGGQEVGIVRRPSTFDHAAYWTGSAASWVNLHPVGATNSGALAVYAGRQVGYADLGGARHASLWTGAASTRLDLHVYLPPSYQSSTATSIWSDASTIVIGGFAYNSLTGRQEAVIWRRCYPDCNGDGVLDLSDFSCFQTKFASGDTYVDCNSDGIRNLTDFGCFRTKFALGCP